MKNLFSMFIALSCLCYAQENLTVLVNEETPPTIIERDTLLTHSSLDKLSVEDYQKFYIGFTSDNSNLEVITLDITNIVPADTNFTFEYTINTHDNRIEGSGIILPAESIIRFQNFEEGRILLPEDGKLVFESLAKDSLNYWKLKEK